jgi:hypothetical protein
MNNEERKQKAQALRDELRKNRLKQLEEEAQNGGNGAVSSESSGTGESASGVGESFNPTFGTTVQATRGEISDTPSVSGDVAHNGGGNNSNRRSVEGFTKQSRQRNRRSSEGNSSPPLNQANGSETGSYTSRIGKLETDEEYSVRTDPDEQEAFFSSTRPEDGAISAKVYYKEDYKRIGRTKKYARIDNEADEISIAEYDLLASRKEQERKEREERQREETSQKEHRQRWFKYEGNTLSEEEAKSLLEPLKAVLLDDLTYLDQAIALRNPNFKDREIWGNLNEHEAETLAELWIKGGQKSPTIATSVRVTVEVKSYAAAVAILGPRIALTAQALREAPPRVRKPVRLFRVAEDEHVH